MKTLIKVCKVLLLLIGVFFILMSFDVFSMEEYTLIEMIGGFFIHSSPGIFLIIITLLLWKKEWIIGIIVIVLTTGLVFLFKVFEDFPEHFLTFLTILLPLYIIGAIFLMNKKRTKA